METGPFSRGRSGPHYQLPHSLVINARAETAGEKPLFRESVAARRCVIPSTGFYEWDRDKRKHLFRLLTTAANASMAPIHDRMPLVLRREQLEPWLREPEIAAALLHTPPPELEVTSAEAQLSFW